MNLKESTLAAVQEMNKWADYLEVFDYMKKNGFFIGNSKTPEKSVSAELYRHAEMGNIDKKKEGRLPVYKKKD